MIKIKSKLEKTVFNGVELKKGIYSYNNASYTRMSVDREFKKHILVKNIEILGLKPVAEEKEEKPDFATMPYKELVAYVRKNKIKTKSMKLADILAALTK